MEDYLEHYGTPRHSGRYPWGSGDNPYQRNKSFMSYVKKLKDQGVSEVNIAKGMGMTTKELRARYSIAKDEKRVADAAEAYRLREKGYSYDAIAKRLDYPNESSIRSLLNPSIQARAEATKATANALKEQVDNNGGYIDIGKGIENYMGCSSTKLDTSVEMLKAQGYVVLKPKIEQLGTGQYTTMKLLCPPGTTYKDFYDNKDKVESVAKWSDDGGRTYLGLKKPKSVSSDRVQIRYAEEGGVDKDGVIELRRGVADISLGQSKYAQVRIAVDDTHYLKGMAVYSDNMPKGVDIVFNTNKHQGTPKKDVLKPLKDDPDNPFGAVVRQYEYKDKNGKTQLSAINIVRQEGEWLNWRKNLPSQMLSKQSPQLAKKQLLKAYDSKLAEYEEISSLTNPVVKKKLLMSFAEDCDSAAVHLKAAAMPRQSTHVLLPLTTIKDNEIYAPQYKDGEKVALIRFPHGGKFEIPELKVNNRNKEGQKLMSKSAADAVGISSKVAERLSGADFDGDTVLVIPNNKKGLLSIQTKAPLEGLKNFDPKEAYPKTKGMKVMSETAKQKKMGEVSNLITDMTIKGATDSELARAVRHSMVVIDAVKHELNYKQSYIDNGIAELAKKYQAKEGGKYGGASTLISKAKSEERVTQRGRALVDKETGEVIYKKKPMSDITYTDKEGNVKTRTSKSTKMAEAKDAYELSSGTLMESIYADHANSLKALANKARKESVDTPNMKMSTSAKKTYAKEVADLEGKLNIALRNAPLERQAVLLSNKILSAKKEQNPDMDKDTIKKIKSQALEEARRRVGANKKAVEINITDREWEAIQAGAISTNKLTQILNNTNEERVKALATPRNKSTMTEARLARGKAMINAGCTIAEAAEALGVSPSTLSKALQ